MFATEAWCGDTIEVASEAYRADGLPILVVAGESLPVSRVNATTVQAILPASPCGPVSLVEVRDQATLPLGTIQTYGFAESFDLSPGAYYWITPVEAPGRTLATGPSANGVVVFDVVARTATTLPGLPGTNGGQQFAGAGLSYQLSRVFWLDLTGVAVAWDYAQDPIARVPAHDPPFGATLSTWRAIHELAPAVWLRVAKHDARINSAIESLEEGASAVWNASRTRMIVRNGWNSLAGFPVFDGPSGAVAYHLDLALPTDAVFSPSGDRLFVSGAGSFSFLNRPGVIAGYASLGGPPIFSDTLPDQGIVAIGVDRSAELVYALITIGPHSSPRSSVGVYSFSGSRVATLAMPDCPGRCEGGTFVVRDQELYFVDIGGTASRVFRFTLPPGR